MAALLQACAGKMSRYGARCRTHRADGSIFCEEDHSDGSDLAPSPTRVLVKFTVNPHIAISLKEAGIRQVEATPSSVQSARMAEHAETAKRIGVNPSPRPGTVDSGTSVFPGDGTDESPGAKNVTLTALMEELGKKEFRLLDVHVLPPKRNRQRRNPPSVLVLSFEKTETEGPFVLGSEAEAKIKELVAKTWTAHVWANPTSDGETVHTVNMVGRSDQQAEYNLTYVDGIWGISLIAVAA